MPARSRQAALVKAMRADWKTTFEQDWEAYRAGTATSHAEWATLNLHVSMKRTALALLERLDANIEHESTAKVTAFPGVPLRPLLTQGLPQSAAPQLPPALDFHVLSKKCGTRPPRQAPHRPRDAAAGCAGARPPVS